MAALLCGEGWAGPLDDLQPGHWYEVQGSHLRDVVPNPAPPGNPTNIMFAWSGGAYDTKRDRLIVWGGGHGDYGGNEIYAFDVATLKWSRIWGPSPDIPATGGKCFNAYPDGNPVSRHTYDGLAYLPAEDQLLIYGGSQYCGSGGAGDDTWVFDFCCGKWTQKAKPMTPAELFMAFTYDPKSGHAFLVNETSPLMEYDPANDSWTKRGDESVDYRTVVVAAIDPGRRKWIGISEDLGPMGKILTSTLTASGTIPLEVTPTKGATEFLGTRVGLQYDLVSDRMIAWGGEGDIHSLDVDTMTWELHAAANEPTPTKPPQSGGVYGRWRYIPSKNAFIGVNSIDDNVWFYKFAPGSGTTDGGGGHCGTCPNPDAGGGAPDGGAGGSTGAMDGGNAPSGSGGKSSTGGKPSSGSGGSTETGTGGRHGSPDAGSTGGASGGSEGTAKASEDSGCGCRVGAGGTRGRASWLFAFGIALLGLRRRRQRLAPLWVLSVAACSQSNTSGSPPGNGSVDSGTDGGKAGSGGTDNTGGRSGSGGGVSSGGLKSTGGASSSGGAPQSDGGPGSGGSSTVPSADWIARSTGSGVIWAHDFTEDEELNVFIRSESPTDQEAVVSNPTPGVLPNGLRLGPTPFGNSRAIVSRAIGTTLAEPAPAAADYPAHDMQVWKVTRALDLPDPAGHPYRALVGNGSDSGGIEWVEIVSVDGAKNEIAVRRKMVAQDGGSGTNTAPMFPAGYTVGRGPQGSWNRPLAAFPKGQNGKKTDDIGIANKTVTKARVWDTTRNGSAHANFREGYFGHRSYWDPAVGPATYKDWKPEDASQTVRKDAWDGDEFFLQFRAKISAARFQAPTAKMLFIQNASTSGSGQFFWTVGKARFGEQPPANERIAGTDYGQLLIGLTSYADSAALAGGYLMDPQTDSIDTTHTAQLSSSYPACTYANHPDGMFCWCFPAEKWVTYLVHFKFGKDNAPPNPNDDGPTPKPPWPAETDPDYRTTFELFVAGEGEKAYHTITSKNDFVWMFGDQKESWGYYYYNPPGLNAFWMSQNLNDYVGSGSVSPPSKPHQIEYTQAILSKQMIPVPSD